MRLAEKTHRRDAESAEKNAEVKQILCVFLCALCALCASAVNSSLELEPCYELPRTLSPDIVRVDEAKAPCQLVHRVASHRSCGIAGRRHGQVEPVEDVEKLCTQLKVHPLLDRESPSEIEILRDLSLPAVIIVEAR